MKPALPHTAAGAVDPSAHQGLAFSLSQLLRQKMASGNGALRGVGESSGGGAGGAGAKWRWNGPGLSGEGEQAPKADFLITRCPPTTLARLDDEGGCFCGKLENGASTCSGYDENDRKAVCVEDLRADVERLAKLEGEDAALQAQAAAPGGERGTVRRSRRRRATCGLEFLSDFRPPTNACPVGYARVGNPDDETAPFICQDTASPYSCGVTQRDCYAPPGILRATCNRAKGECEITMCQEGWRFYVDESPSGAASCVPSKPLFFNPPAA
ncbi:hypothetical protein JCM11641_007417 [Rhodosporidiobolus odoratus]